MQQGAPAHTVIGEVKFTGKGLAKLRNAGSDLPSYRAVAAIRPTLESGEYLGRENLRKERSDGTVAFHRFAATVDIGGDVRRMAVVVTEDKFGNKYYDLNLKPGEGSSLTGEKSKPGGRPSDEAAPNSGTEDTAHKAGPGTEDGGATYEQVGTPDNDVNLHLSAAREFAPGFEQHDVSAGRDLGQTTRGKININDGGSVITLMRDANASTFMHETGHDWLEKLLGDAKDERAPADLVADEATVRTWLGAGPDDAITILIALAYYRMDRSIRSGVKWLPGRCGRFRSG